MKSRLSNLPSKTSYFEYLVRYWCECDRGSPQYLYPRQQFVLVQNQREVIGIISTEMRQLETILEQLCSFWRWEPSIWLKLMLFWHFLLQDLHRHMGILCQEYFRFCLDHHVQFLFLLRPFLCISPCSSSWLRYS